MNYSTERSCLGFWSEKEARLEAAHILDLVDAVLYKDSTQVTTFLSFAMRKWAEDILTKEHLALRAEGGFQGAERVRLIIGPSGETLHSADANISLLWVRPTNPRLQLEHRQILGSLMGLGFRREVLGDIQAGQKGQYIATTTEIAPFLLDHWSQAGREKIQVSLYEGKPEVCADTGEEHRITVNSSRIDAVVAKAFGVSRSVAQGWIVQGKLRSDGLVVSRVDTEVQPDEMISCRGQGRIKLVKCTPTRKDRTAWQIVIFRSKSH